MSRPRARPEQEGEVYLSDGGGSAVEGADRFDRDPLSQFKHEQRIGSLPAGRVTAGVCEAAATDAPGATVVTRGVCRETDLTATLSNHEP
jgi:hypothetical protein